MTKRTYIKTIYQAFRQSKGRFLSIVFLMALGSFALVGLKVSAPNMYQTARLFFDKQQVADISVMADYGLSQDDQTQIEQLANQATIEYGYLKDVSISDSQQVYRLFSKPEQVSLYAVTKGRLPDKADEIALADLHQDYAIGSDITFTETGETILKQHTFKVVGYVQSSELLSRVDLGQTTIGTGALYAYGVVLPSVFDSPVKMVARLHYQELDTLDAYSDTYVQRVTQLKAELETLLGNQPAKRLADVKAEAIASQQAGQAQVDNAKQQLADAAQQLVTAQTQIDRRKAQLSQVQVVPQADLLQIQAAQAQLDAQKQAYATQKVQVEKDIASAEEHLKVAANKIDALTLPTYSVYTRRDMPGATGYRTYENNAKVIDAVGNIFPIVLYFVAALVTLTTMTRFVDEERIQIGTLKALGYHNRHILAKFIIYGLVASFTGTTIGVLLGHTLLPRVIATTYANSSAMPSMQLYIYPMLILLAYLLATLSAVIPAFIVVQKTLKEKTARLLLPKPPANGSSIALEKITWLWKRLSFTQKVTARNIFRYKLRMFMTIFGVCGAVALLFSGLGIRSSIADLNIRQFEELIQYDMVVAENNYMSEQERRDLNAVLDDSQVKQQLPVRFQELHVYAGNQNDRQSIALMGLAQFDDYQAYMHLIDRQTQENITFDTHSVVVSEKLARLLHAKAGDTITLFDVAQQAHALRITAITEMYMGHFIFIGDAAYQDSFAQPFVTNAHLVLLQDKSQAATEVLARQLTQLPAVKAIVQNTTQKTQIQTIVKSLNTVMYVLIVASVLLAMVILYNLTHINIAERIRELSTVKVLGFYAKEVTMYIYRETIYLSLIGIVLGFYLGSLLHQYIIEMIPPDYVLFNPAVSSEVYVIPTVLIVGIMIVLGMIINRWLKKIDMLEALKEVG